MAQKTDTKTKRKPTQLDRIEKEVKYLTRRVEQVGVLANNVAEISDRVADCRREVSRLLPPSPPAVVEEQWVPKVGDLIFINDKHSHPPWHNTMVVVTSIRGEGTVPCFTHHIVQGSLSGNGSALDFMYRKPTESEVLAYKEGLERSKKEAEWALVTELQKGDGCEATAEQRLELKEVLGLKDDDGCWASHGSVEWDPNLRVHLQCMANGRSRSEIVTIKS